MMLGAVGRIRSLTAEDDPIVAFEQSGAAGSALARLLLMLPVAAIGLLPFAWLAAEAAGRPEVLNALADRPGSALLLGLGLATVAGLLLYPTRAILDGFASGRTVYIADGQVSVAEDRLFGQRTWSEPLAAYAGVAHHIRASLSGSRHEIVLVHPDRTRSVLLAFDTSIRESELQLMAARLGLPMIPPRRIYSPE